MHLEQICGPVISDPPLSGAFLMGRKFFLIYPHWEAFTTSVAVGVPEGFRTVFIILDHAAFVLVAKNFALSM